MSSNNYTVVRNKVLQNDELHWKTRGIFAYMLSLPDDWEFFTTEIAKHSKHDGIAVVKSGLQELEKNGYLIRIQPRNSKGQFGQSNWLLIDNPEEKLTKTEYAKLFELHDPQTGIGPQNQAEDENVDISAFSPQVENQPADKKTDVKAFSPQVKNRLTDETLDKTDFSPQVDFPPADKPQAVNRPLQSKHIQSKQEQKESKNELINNDLGKNADLISLVENQWGPINEEAKQLINSFTLIYDHDLVVYVLETFNKNGHSKAGLINYLTASLKNIAAKGLTSREEVIAEHQKKFRKVEGNNNKPNPPTKVIPIFKIGDDWE